MSRKVRVMKFLCPLLLLTKKNCKFFDVSADNSIFPPKQYQKSQYKQDSSWCDINYADKSCNLLGRFVVRFATFSENRGNNFFNRYVLYMKRKSLVCDEQIVLKTLNGIYQKVIEYKLKFLLMLNNNKKY
jgi:hypothetical protein